MMYKQFGETNSQTRPPKSHSVTPEDDLNIFMEINTPPDSEFQHSTASHINTPTQIIANPIELTVFNVQANTTPKRNWWYIPLLSS